MAIIYWASYAISNSIQILKLGRVMGFNMKIIT